MNDQGMMLTDPTILKLIDIGIFIVANALNILFSAVFLFRFKDLKNYEYILGILSIILVLPLAAITLFNLNNSRDWWTYILPLPMIVFLVLELFWDYIFKINFRKNRLIIPYLLFFYLGLFGLIGYSFLIGKLYGFITLVTYFINLSISLYGLSKKKLH